MDWGSIDTLPEIVGLALFTDGHIGYYVGGGYAVEWRGFNYGCVKTVVKERTWKHFSGMIVCGKCGCSFCGHRTPTSRKKGDSLFVTWRCSNRNRQQGCDCADWHNPELFAAADAVLGVGSLEDILQLVERIRAYDDKLVFELKNGRKQVWRRK